jgi:hypothetical protein
VGTGFSLCNADNFFFVWDRTTNSTVFEARLDQTEENPGCAVCAAYGIMIRESIAVDAPFVCIWVSSDKLWWTAREWAGDTAKQQLIEGLKARPVYLQLKRNGTSFAGAYATNEVVSPAKPDWIECWTDKVRRPFRSYLPGLAICSGKPNEQAAADFDRLVVRP